MRLMILGGDGYLGWPTALRFSDQHAGLLTVICASATTIWLLIRWRRNRASGAKTGFP